MSDAASETRLPEPLPGGRLAQAGPFALLVAQVAYLAWKWPQLPGTLITHWTASFEPDGFSEKGVLLVFGIPVLGLALCAMVLLIAWSLLRPSRRLLPDPVGRAMDLQRRRAVATLLLWIEYLLALNFSALGLMPLAQTPARAKALLVAVVITVVVGPVVVLLVWLARFRGTLRFRVGGRDTDPAERRHWKLGVIYFNPADPGLWVEKRIGIGYTFNFARPAAWWILAALVGIPLGLTLALALLT